MGEKIPVLNTPVGEIMSEPIIPVSPKTTLRDAEQEMDKLDISCLVVTKKLRLLWDHHQKRFPRTYSTDGEKRKLTLQISAKDVEMDETDRRILLQDFDSFARKYQEALEFGTIFVYITAHGRNYKGKQLIHCRLQLRRLKGSFFPFWGRVRHRPSFQFSVDQT